MLLNRLALQAVFARVFGDHKLPPPQSGLLPVVNMGLRHTAGGTASWRRRWVGAFSRDASARGQPPTSATAARRSTRGRAASRSARRWPSPAAPARDRGPDTPSLLTRLLLSFFNLRDGWWLGSPGLAGGRTYSEGHPRSALYPLLADAPATEPGEGAYVSLSGGDEFEPLGIYQMVLRRCRVIVVVDGSEETLFSMRRWATPSAESAWTWACPSSSSGGTTSGGERRRR